jgi:acetyltransferase-like isoleucine patch superfamily enzyme
MNRKVSDFISCGNDVFISENVEIRRPQLVKLGNHIAVDSGFYCTTALEIGDHVHIAPYTVVIGGANAKLTMSHFTNISVGGRIICGSDEFLGNGLISAPGIPAEFRDELDIRQITFEMFANVGANVTILPGVTLGEGSVIGACSLVTGDTEPWTIYIGNPAKPLKVRPKQKMIEYAKKMGFII